MPGRPMVHLTTVGGVFHGQVVAARLGAEGVLTELRGAVGAIYPLGGEVLVFVDPDQVEEARHILLADQVDAALGDRVGDLARLTEAGIAPAGEGWVGRAGPGAGTRHWRRRPWSRVAWLVVATVLMVYLVITLG